MNNLKRTEILIAGGGIVGSLMAIALAENGFEVVLVDPSFETSSQTNRICRSYAISRTSKILLKNLGVWGNLDEKFEPITKIVLSEANKEAMDVTKLAEFDLQDESKEPTSYMVEDLEIRTALNLKLQASKNVEILTNCKVLSEEVAKGGSIISLDNDKRIYASLFVICDGPKSSIAKTINKKFIFKDYNQVAIVANVNHKNRHKGEAHQIFFTGGPIASLPLKGNRSAIVWSEEKKKGFHVSQSKKENFLEELKAKLSNVLVDISLDSEKYVFPLSLSILRDFVDERRVFIGDSAHTIHPLAGQGLNLGLRDIASLTEILVNGKKIGEDIGSIGLLKRYEQWRSFDRFLLSSYTDGINALFSNDNKILRALRRLGLKAIDSSTNLKTAFMNEAAGEYGHLPILLKEM